MLFSNCLTFTPEEQGARRKITPIKVDILNKDIDEEKLSNRRTVWGIVMVMENNSTCQDQRTLLREKFLRMLGSLNGKTAQIVMYEKALVQGILGPADVDFHHFQVCELKTPMGVLPDAILRTSDMISVKIENVDQS